MEPDTINLRAGRREWIGLAVLALPTMLLSLDLTVLYLALPHLSTELDASSTQQLWIIDIYGFMTAGFLITMGTLGDRIGRRRLLLIGATSFGVASVLAAYSTGPEMLIATRALLGVAGATLLPSTLALIRSMFSNPKQFGVAVAGWSTSYMAGVALGPVVGGLMLEHFWWGSVFLLGVPVMALLLLTGPLVLPSRRDASTSRLDPASVALSLAAVLPIVYGFKEMARHGWQPLPTMAMVAGAAFAVVFVARQRNMADPFLDLRLFGIRAVGATLLIALLVAAIQNGNMLMATLYLQLVEGLSPLRAGLWLVLPSVALVVTINAAPHLARRIRPGSVFAVGLVVSAIGYLVLTGVNGSGAMPILMVGLVIVYAGVGLPGALVNQLVLGSVPPNRAGSAASMASTSGELGISLGIATLGSVGTAVYRGQFGVPGQLPDDTVRAARESIGDAASEADQLPAALGAELLNTAREAFTTALNTVAGVSIVLVLAVAVLGAVTLRHIPPTGKSEPDQDMHDNDGADHTGATAH